MEPSGILEAALYVSEIDRAAEFYGKVIGLKQISKDSQRHVFFYCGESIVLLFRADATKVKTSEVPEHGSEGQGHLAFCISSEEIDDWRAHLTKCEIEIEAEVTWPAGGYSIYFRDPDGNSIELATKTVWPERAENN